MNNQELAAKVNSSMYRQCRSRGYAATVDVLMDIGVLPKDKYEDWRFGRIPYLERVCMVNLGKLSTVRHQMRVYAQKAGLKPSFCCYKQWGVKKKGGQGRKPVIHLRFSKSGNPEVERWYYFRTERSEVIFAMFCGCRCLQRRAKRLASNVLFPSFKLGNNMRHILLILNGLQKSKQRSKPNRLQRNNGGITRANCMPSLVSCCDNIVWLWPAG